MKQRKKLYVVAYDLQDDRSRNKVAKLLERYGVRVNFSVFECLFTEKQLQSLLERMEKLMDKRTDRIIFYPICLNCYVGIIRQPKWKVKAAQVDIV